MYSIEYIIGTASTFMYLLLKKPVGIMIMFVFTYNYLHKILYLLFVIFPFCFSLSLLFVVSYVTSEGFIFS